MTNCAFLNKEKRREKLEAELKRILSILKTLDIEKIILFGSLASNNISSTSDIDIVVIRKTEKRFLDRLEDICSRKA